MQRADFLMTAGAVIPVLVLALIFEARAFDVPATLAQRRWMKIPATFLVAWLLVPAIGGESVCLHCLYVSSNPTQNEVLVIILGLGFPVCGIVSGILARIWVT